MSTYSEAEVSKRLHERGWRKAFTVAEMVDKWEGLVSEVEQGYTHTIHEYTNDLYSRNWLQEASGLLHGFVVQDWTPQLSPSEEYLQASREAVPSMVADYRASAGVDIEHDRADRAGGALLRMPVGVVQQDWGAALGYDAEAVWRTWAPDLDHRLTAAGHFMAEEDPAMVVKILGDLLAR